MGKTKESLFKKNNDDIIKKFMHEWGHLPNAYKKISKEVPQYTAKQIRQRWKNHLDPNLCHDVLGEEEKIFIVQWVEANQKTPNSTIHWKDLIREIENKFGKLRSENKIKNFWYPKKRSLKSEAQIEQQEVNYEPYFPSEDENEDDIALSFLPTSDLELVLRYNQMLFEPYIINNNQPAIYN